jgi:hypothetical protein
MSKRLFIRQRLGNAYTVSDDRGPQAARSCAAPSSGTDSGKPKATGVDDYAIRRAVITVRAGGAAR